MTEKREKILKKLEDAWLNINVDDRYIYNPLAKIPPRLEDDPHVYILWLLMQPEYISFICKEIIGIEISPLQGLLLQEFWWRKFPMLIASRGFSKCVKDTYIVTDNGFRIINDLFKDDDPYDTPIVCDTNILGESGFKKPAYKYKKSKTTSIKLTTSNGFTIHGSTEHPIRVLDNDKIVWKKLKDIIYYDKAVIDLSTEWFPNVNNLTEQSAYTIGTITDDTNSQDFPQIILSASKSAVSAYIRGLLDISGCVSDVNSSIRFTLKSEAIVKSLQFILTRFGIISNINKDNDCWCLSIKDLYYDLFCQKILNKKTELLNNDLSITKYFFDTISLIESDNTELYDFYIPDDHSYISGGFISHNSFLGALYVLLRLLLLPGRKIVICGASFRQSKIIFEYMESFYNNSPILKDIIGNYGKNGPRRDVDMCRFTIDNSYAVALPIGTGDKIRGQRANDIWSDEFSSIGIQIFEEVIFGFGAVTSDPIINVKQRASRKKAKAIGIDIPNDNSAVISNQVIISGTADYDFTSFGKYWKRWKSIIESGGDTAKLEAVFEGSIPKNFNWKNYSIFRIPHDIIPEGFMDEEMIARAQATLDRSIYLNEYCAVFSKDSSGFFKRTLIESCVANSENKISHPSCENINFCARLFGQKDRKYVMAIDPCAGAPGINSDNFSICILELHGDHRRIVYCWTTTKKEVRERVQLGLISETDFYSFCARKIRDLMLVFNCDRISIDAQGGGYAVMEALNDESVIKRELGEVYLWSIINPDKQSDTDIKAGNHIIEIVQFANAEYTYHANHNLKKDLESKQLLFPSFDNLTIGYAELDDTQKNRLYDGMEDCIANIEELKNELATIVMTKTANGRDRWDTPETKESGSKKGKMRKDRYSALLMANAAARSLQVESTNPDYGFGRRGETSYYDFMDRDMDVPYVGNNPLAEILKDVY